MNFQKVRWSRWAPVIRLVKVVQVARWSGCQVVRGSGGQVARWSGDQVVRWSGGQVIRWSGDQVVIYQTLCPL